MTDLEKTKEVPGHRELRGKQRKPVRDERQCQGEPLMGFLSITSPPGTQPQATFQGWNPVVAASRRCLVLVVSVLNQKNRVTLATNAVSGKETDSYL